MTSLLFKVTYLRISLQAKKGKKEKKIFKEKQLLNKLLYQFSGFK